MNFEFDFFWFFCRREVGGEGFYCRRVCRFSLWARPCERVPPFDGEVAGLSDGGLMGLESRDPLLFFCSIGRSLVN